MAILRATFYEPREVLREPELYMRGDGKKSRKPVTPAEWASIARLVAAHKTRIPAPRRWSMGCWPSCQTHAKKGRRR